MTTDIDIAHLRQWVGREQVMEQTIEPFATVAMSGLLDQAAPPGMGEALPLPWHWLYFLDAPARAATGVDGHPLRGGFLPPVPLPRRMWAAGAMQCEVPLRVGAPARKRSTVRSVDLKEGRSGPLVFVVVDHVLEQEGRTCLREEQNIVYREAPTAPAPLPPGEQAPKAAQWSATLKPDPALLFRFSALTYNGHRIHYDRDYAVREEFYPALVVHGPLLATALLELVAQGRPGAAVRAFDFRALRPAFDTDTLQLCATAEGDTVELWTQDAQGVVGMTARATLG
ncbi:acyl-CoA dehydrogenase [Hydrogenophaga sp.]|uniref:acyl-CoA dehydrogenase n=1 Tax=Hydrogenophaga sp. TaxID=1904254 RepID=UPI00271C742A|nr:acyl-CoA dehydrogenase [Hydrogenophaga sp.]MDO8906579.1 acyl-CoA dehydrogenase [Hydrogenophaga sp.]